KNRSGVRAPAFHRVQPGNVDDAAQVAADRGADLPFDGLSLGVDALIYKLGFRLGGLNLDGLDVRASDFGFTLLETPLAVEGIACAGRYRGERHQEEYRQKT